MSDLMLHGVLNMPPDLWDGGALDVMQRHGRYKQASKRINELAAALRDLVAQVEHADGTAQINLEKALLALDDC